MDPKCQALIEVLDRAKELLALPGNDFVWSSWENAEQAWSEIDQFIDALANGNLLPRLDINVLFAPTGPIQDVSISSGWGDEFLTLAKRFDQAMEQAYIGRAIEGETG